MTIYRDEIARIRQYRLKISFIDRQRGATLAGTPSGTDFNNAYEPTGLGSRRSCGRARGSSSARCRARGVTRRKQCKRRGARRGERESAHGSDFGSEVPEQFILAVNVLAVHVLAVNTPISVFIMSKMSSAFNVVSVIFFGIRFSV